MTIDQRASGLRLVIAQARLFQIMNKLEQQKRIGTTG
jgi:hypothetical protein